MITREQVISIGTLAKPFGIQGQILCHTKNDLWQGGDFLIISIDNILVPFRVVDYHDHGLDMVFSLAGITNEEQARRLTNREAYMLRSDVQEDMEDEMLWTDLAGYRVTDTDQGELGIITAIDDSTENILATLSPIAGLSPAEALRSSLLIPLNEDFLVAIDEEARVITLTLPYQL